MSKPTLPQGLPVPYAQEAEEATIGVVLVNPAAFLAVASFLKPEYFYILRHSYIWEAFTRLDERGDAIDFVTVQEELRTMNRLNDIGGPAYLLQLINNTPTSVHVEVYGRLVERAAIRRRLLTAADEIRALAVEEDLPLERVVIESIQRIDSINVQNRERYLPGTASIAHYADVLDDLMERQERGEMIGIPLPEQWDRFGEVLPAIFPGDFVVVSGPPGGGKSAMLESWAEWTASQKLPCAYYHTEMSTEQMLHRRMARRSGVPYHVLASGKVERGMAEGEDTMMSRIVAADEEIDKFSPFISYHWMPDVKFNRLASEMRRAVMRGVKVFFIDHFQDIQVDTPRGQNEVRAFESMCVWFAAFAENQKVVVFMASQQNAKGSTKWSSKLIEKAVTWISIRRERLNSEYAYLHNGVEVRALVGEDSPVTEISVNKARFGKKAKLKMLYHGPGFAFFDMSRVQRPPVSGKVITIDELKARKEAKEVGS